MKKVIVTGGAGFIGSNLVKYLLKKKYFVINIDKLRDRIYDELQFIRIYMRPKGGETDFKEPLIIRKNSSVLDVCNKLHRKMRRDFRFGLIWGKSVKFGGQRVGLAHKLQDEDVLTIIKRK